MPGSPRTLRTDTFIVARIQQLRAWMLMLLANAWLRFYNARYQLAIALRRHRGWANAAALFILVLAAYFGSTYLQAAINASFAPSEILPGIRSLAAAVGVSLIGATAIVTSLVLFATQINVERMPHGLFRRIGGDSHLLAAFVAAFALSVLVASLSLVNDEQYIGLLCATAVVATILVVWIFHYSYRRALDLISPDRQLAMMVSRVMRTFRATDRHARRLGPVFGSLEPRELLTWPQTRQVDMPRLIYFQKLPHWADEGRRAVQFAVSLARRYSAQGDPDAVSMSIDAVVSINRGYVNTKGDTFFTDSLMFENPLTSDSFLNESLEQLRQLVAEARARRDEFLIRRTLKAFAELAATYSQIDYRMDGAHLYHAQLAVGYLNSEMQRLLSQDMPDVLMDGARLVGGCGELLLRKEGPNSVREIAQKLAMFGGACAAIESHRPVTLVAVEQLARLSFALIGCESRDVQFVARDLRKQVVMLATVVLAIPDSVLSRNHSYLLGPYFSSTTDQALKAWLAKLVNSLAGADANDERAQKTIRQLSFWADRIYETEKEILLLAVKQRSHFTFDILHWVTDLAGILIFAANLPGCQPQIRTDLRRQATWLIATISWLPKDADSMAFLETYDVPECLFRSARAARDCDADEFVAEVADLLVQWMFQAGVHARLRNSLELCALALALMAVQDKKASLEGRIVAKIGERIGKPDKPSDEWRTEAAADIRQKADEISNGSPFGVIEAAAAGANNERLQEILQKIATAVAP